MTKQDVWDSITTSEAKERMKRLSWGDQLAEAWQEAARQRRMKYITQLQGDQSDIETAFAGDRHYPPAANPKGWETK